MKSYLHKKAIVKTKSQTGCKEITAKKPPRNILTISIETSHLAKVIKKFYVSAGQTEVTTNKIKNCLYVAWLEFGLHPAIWIISQLPVHI